MPCAAGAPLKRAKDKSDFVFAYFGNLSRVKGAGDLLAAAELLAARGVSGFSVQVNGSQLFDDKAFDDLLAGARAALGGRLIFPGRYEQGEIAARMAEADCVVFPSLWWENAPLVIYEALHHGKPVIAYPQGGAAEILRRHNTGILAAQWRPDALANAMQAMLEGGVAEAGPVNPPLQSMAQFASAYEDIYSGSSAQESHRPRELRRMTG